MCCTHHFTSFAVGRPSNVQKKYSDPTEFLLLVLDLCMIVSLVLSAAMDYKKCLVVGKKKESSKEMELRSAAAAEFEQKNDMNKGLAGLRSDQKLKATDINTYIGETPVKSSTDA